jgi:cytochrome c553
LEDQVGFVGPFATASVPHDTSPPAAPQALHVVGTSAHRVPKFDVGWDNVADAGSPINTAHYQVIDGSGGVVVPAQVAGGDNIEAIRDIATPPQTGALSVRVWLTDAEGNVGAAATVSVPRDATPPAAPQDLSVAAPASSRASEGFDLRWRNLVDDGSPVDAAHYKIVNSSGGGCGSDHHRHGRQHRANRRPRHANRSRRLHARSLAERWGGQRRSPREGAPRLQLPERGRRGWFYADRQRRESTRRTLPFLIKERARR